MSYMQIIIKNFAYKCKNNNCLFQKYSNIFSLPYLQENILIEKFYLFLQFNKLLFSI